MLIVNGISQDSKTKGKKITDSGQEVDLPFHLKQLNLDKI